MSKLLLREYYDMCAGGICQDFLTEQEKIEVKNGAIYLTGIFSIADKKNGNGRTYPYKQLYEEVLNFQKLIKENRATGNIDHDDSTVIELQQAAHLIKELWWQDKTLFGKTKILSTEKGKILRALINDGVQLSVSSRALGELTESQDEEIGQVVGSLEIITWDIVATPSVEEAKMKPQYINESLYKQYRQSLTKSDRIYRALNKILTEQQQ